MSFGLLGSTDMAISVNAQIMSVGVAGDTFLDFAVGAIGRPVVTASACSAYVGLFVA
jgi:hypothetical protein